MSSLSRVQLLEIDTESNQSMIYPILEPQLLISPYSIQPNDISNYLTVEILEILFKIIEFIPSLISNFQNYEEIKNLKSLYNEENNKRLSRQCLRTTIREIKIKITKLNLSVIIKRKKILTKLGIFTPYYYITRPYVFIIFIGLGLFALVAHIIGVPIEYIYRKVTYNKDYIIIDETITNQESNVTYVRDVKVEQIHNGGNNEILNKIINDINKLPKDIKYLYYLIKFICKRIDENLNNKSNTLTNKIIHALIDFFKDDNKNKIDIDNFLYIETYKLNKNIKIYFVFTPFKEYILFYNINKNNIIIYVISNNILLTYLVNSYKSDNNIFLEESNISMIYLNEEYIFTNIFRKLLHKLQ
jgi:hypothetical protein